MMRTSARLNRIGPRTATGWILVALAAVGALSLAIAPWLFFTGAGTLATGQPSPAAHPSAPPADHELKLVVALFRHGVRSPSPDFASEADKHPSPPKYKWPTLTDWKVMGNDCDSGNGWGYLTTHGQEIARGLGEYYGSYYKQGDWSSGFKVYLWADSENQRTRETAKALAQGFVKAGIRTLDVTTASLGACTVDLLFHPFKAGCGTPDPTTLTGIAKYINSNWRPTWTERYKTRFDQLFRVLDCSSASDCAFTNDYAIPWSSGEERQSPIKWKGRFSYASSASEAFLLEYANNMQVGWGRVDTAALRTMPFLHEFFFDQTERRRYLAQIQGSNLIKEIFNVTNRKATGKQSGCPHAPAESQFVGLVGHDTNLAHVGVLLDLHWKFDDARLPDDTKGLPENDALPAGALVFELRQRDGAYFVRVEYVAQSLQQMRNKTDLDKAFRLQVRGSDCDYQFGPCEIPLEKFKQRVEREADKKFLSTCGNGTNPQQICVQTPASRRRIKKGRNP